MDVDQRDGPVIPGEVFKKGRPQTGGERLVVQRSGREHQRTAPCDEARATERN